VEAVLEKEEKALDLGATQARCTTVHQAHGTARSDPVARRKR